MKKLQSWRDTISWLVAAITVALSYDIENKGYFRVPEIGIAIIDDILPTFLAAILLLSSLYIARSISKRIIKTDRVRAYILGEDYVEGFWYLQTDPLEEAGNIDTSPLTPDGVLWLRYEPEYGEFAVLTTRLDSSDKPYQVASKLIHMREEQQRLLYVNYFVVEHEGNHPKEGVSKGRFVKKGDFSKTKDRLDAYIFSEGENTRHQVAEKIPKSVITEFHKIAEESGSGNWMEEYLRRKLHN